MIRTLTGRLILSHVLPFLIIISLAGLTLDYVLETRFLLTNLADELKAEAILVAELAADHPEIWGDPAQAQAFVNRAGLPVAAQAMLVDVNGMLLASTAAADAKRVGQPPENMPDLADLLSNEVTVQTDFRRDLQTNIVDIFVPVLGPDRQVVGVVRLTQQLTNVYDQFLMLRYLIAAVLAVGLLVGGGMAWFLGNNLGQSLHQVTQAAHRLSNRQRLEPLPEQGPEEIKQLSRAVNTLVEQLETLEQNRRRLLANLVHELSNPLSALRSATHALLGGAGDDTMLHQELLLGMQGEEERLNRLLADLSGLYDQVSGSLELQVKQLPLTPFLRRVLGFWRETAHYKGLQWQVDIPNALPIIAADEDRLAQVVGNLLSNAIKYTPANNAVSVSAGCQDNEVWIQVSDTGIGIETEEQAHIFTPFYRSSANARFTDGMGLGLSIAQDLVAAHGGRLTCISNLGAGSQFTIWLPIT
ncbi:MAG: sensor histidine kinase [Anaerolineae bacterium]